MSFFDDEDEDEETLDEAEPAEDGLAPEQKDALYESLKSKYGRASERGSVHAAEEKAGSQKTMSMAGQALANYGRSMAAARGVQTPDNSDFYESVRRNADQDVSNARQGRKDRMDSVLTEDSIKSKDDARTSAEQSDKVWQSIASRKYPGTDFKGMSAGDVQKRMLQLDKEGEGATRITEADKDRKSREGMASKDRWAQGEREKNRIAAEKARDDAKIAAAQAQGAAAGADGQPRSPYDESVANLRGDQRARFDNSVMALKSVEDMSQALLADNENTFSMVGDNNFTMARTQWEEAIGRMQSGGAITDDEGVRFRKLVPTATDSRAIQEKKLREMAGLMSGRIDTMGVDPREAMKHQRTTTDQIALPGASTKDSATAGAGLVNMKAPDGSVRAVPRDQVEKYKAKGAVEVP